MSAVVMCPVSGSECRTERCADVGCWAAEERLDDTPPNKHDFGCRRRKAESGFIYLCTCDLTDEQVDAALASSDTKDER